MSDEYDKLPRVVHVTDEYTVTINHGANDGINEESRFLVFYLGPEIEDPETGESLGRLEVIRGKAEVIHLQPKLTTLKSIETETIPGTRKIIRRQKGSAFIALQSIYGPEVEEIEENPRRVEVELNAEKGDYAKPI